MKHLPLLLFLAACAPSAPTTYSQGVPVAPRPPAFNPTTDAPHTVGQPGHVRPPEEYPRSPHGRVLPQTPETRREPGIWATQTPGNESEPTILGVSVPIPPKSPAGGIQPSAHCAQTMSVAAANPDIARAVARLTPQARQCLAARLYQECLNRWHLGLTEERAEATYFDREESERIRAALRVAAAFTATSCNGLTVEPWFLELNTAIVDAWRELMRSRGAWR